MQVVLAEDDLIFRIGLAHVLSEAGFDVVGQAGTAVELLERVEELSPEVAVIDVRMPPTRTVEGLEAALEVRRRFPGTAVLLLSHDVQTSHLRQLTADGTARLGYLVKERVASLERFCDDLRTVGGGGSVLDPLVVEQMMRTMRAADRLMALTDRESQVLALMAKGRSNQAIAKEMSLRLKTVEIYIGRVFEKLGLEAGRSMATDRRVVAVLTYLASQM